MNLTAISLIVASIVTLGVTVNSLKTTLPVQGEDKTLEVAKVPIAATDRLQSGSKFKLKELNLSNNRQVYVYGIIDSGNSSLIAKQILYLGKSPEPLTVIINSPGGSVVDGAEIISAMEAAKGPVNTLCVELCASMAAMIHQYGTNRLMINRALVMFHPASGGLEGEVDKMSSRLGTLKRYIGKMEANVAKRAKISYDEYKRLSGVELWLDAEDAVNQGFADSIVFVRGADAEKLYLDSPQGLRGDVPAPRILPSTPITLPVFSPTHPNFNWM